MWETLKKGLQGSLHAGNPYPNPAVLVQATKTNCHRLGDLNNTHLFLKFWRLEVRVPAQSESGEDPVPGCR